MRKQGTRAGDEESLSPIGIGQLASLGVCLALVLPLLVLFSGRVSLALTVLGLAATALAIPKKVRIIERAGLLVGPIFVIAASLVIGRSSADQNLWAFCFPGALLVARPTYGLPLTLVMLLLVSQYSEASLMLPAALLVTIIAACAAAASRKILIATATQIYRPVEHKRSAILRIFSVFTLVYAVGTLYFAVLYAGLTTIQQTSFQIQNGSPTFADFLIFSAMIGSAGEVVYLTPISPAARASVVVQMTLSFLFTAVYLVVLGGALLEQPGGSNRGDNA